MITGFQKMARNYRLWKKLMRPEISATFVPPYGREMYGFIYFCFWEFLANDP